ncbi:MAG: RNA polymerase factor sigma-32 [Myxococcales bacterium]|nr:RNA polymerase factor sigma-32 [Polyangiaceae bacterium]MDW8248424.1 RNA polymerase factor sigma-32 [Myxococcales bacterium]
MVSQTKPPHGEGVNEVNKTPPAPTPAIRRRIVSGSAATRASAPANVASEPQAPRKPGTPGEKSVTKRMQAPPKEKAKKTESKAPRSRGEGKTKEQGKTSKDDDPSLRNPTQEPAPSSLIPLPPASAPGNLREEDEGQEQVDEDLVAVESTVELLDPEEEVLDDGENWERGSYPLSLPLRSRDKDDDDGKLALSRNDPLQAYLREVQKHPLLSPEEEQTLAQRYAATQDVDAAARLVTANLRLVVKIAYEYRRAYKNIMDLIQEGNIGLMQAVKKYDPNRGVKLSSYSAWWIRAYILRYIINNWRLVKLGTTQAQRKLFFNLNKEKAKLAAMGIDPTPEKIAKNLGVEEQEAAEMERRLSSGEMSLDAPVGDNEGRPVSRIELIASGSVGPDSAVATEELNDIVRTKLEEFRTRLKGKDLDIFDKRLLADEPLTLQELGDHFGISRERVRQIEARLTMNLRQFLVEALGDAVEV